MAIQTGHDVEGVVFDASALIAYVRSEPGAEIAENHILAGGWISMVNWAEVLAKIAEYGGDHRATVRQLRDSGLLGQLLLTAPLTEDDCNAMADLRQATKSLGLSLGDRACLALALRLKKPVVTAERQWSRLNLTVPVFVIR